MAEPKPSVHRTASTAVGRLCQIVYELALLFAGLLAVLAPIHQAATWHADVDQIVGADLVVVSCPGASRLSPGDTFPVYRFNPDWKTEIGRATVETVFGARVVMRYDPRSFRWPMGRQARVTESSGDAAKIDMGADLGLRPGDELNLFEGRQLVGRVSLTQVDASSSWAHVLECRVPNPAGLLASEFSFATQVVIFKSPLLSALEILSAVLLLGVYLVAWFRFRRSPLLELGERLRPAVRRPAHPLLRRAFGLLAGIPFVWFLVRFTIGVLVYLVHLAAPLLGANAPAVAAALRGSLNVLYGIGALLYCFLLFRTGRSPILAFWRRMSFAGGPLKWAPTGIPRHAVTWLLHLVIAYAFASALLSFARSNLTEALATAWPDSGIELTGSLDFGNLSAIGNLLAGIGAATGYILTHAPHFKDLDAFYLTARYLLWTLTIAGCLFGYGYSILGYLWGKRIRNLDFTLAGWVTNAVCYGPLLGAVVWQMVPPLRGIDPIFASGPLYHMNLAVELFMNVAYTITIWNLGAMFGVMTDKGLRTTGFYSVVRHPSYTLEALMFIALEMKALTTGYQWLAACMFLFIYWVRSEREDDFMSRSNPDYAAYRKATPYKFIPGIY